MHVYRPYAYPHRAARLTPALFQDLALSIGAGSSSATVTVAAAGVLVSAASASVVIDSSAISGDFLSSGFGSAACEITVQADAVIVASNEFSADAVHGEISASALDTAAGGPADATITVSISAQAIGVAIVPGGVQGEGNLDSRNFIERKVENRPEYYFSNGARTRQFFQRKP